jgi:hypothetical protein
MFTSQNIAVLASVVWALEQGLDIDRLIFARHLVRTGRVSDWLPIEDDSALERDRAWWETPEPGAAEAARTSAALV